MNTFRNENIQHTFIVKKTGKINAENLKIKIKEKFPDKEEDEFFSLVYIYYLKKAKFKYPKKMSDILYIGSTIGEKNNNVRSAAFRFVHLRGKKDCKQNLTLSYYYNKGYVIGLDIFKVEDCKQTEKKWRYDFLNEYGSLPIAEGASYSKNKIK